MKKLAGFAVGCALGMGQASTARATLGQDAQTVESDAQREHAAHAVRVIASVERHELTLPSGLVLREYVAHGKVFALTWRGRRAPRLRELLGAYFAELERPGGCCGVHRLSVRGADVFIQASGDGRWFAGKSWVPSLVPEGLRPEIDLGFEP